MIPPMGEVFFAPISVGSINAKTKAERIRILRRKIEDIISSTRFILEFQPKQIPGHLIRACGIGN